jgi:hypothetical protein
MIGWPNGLKKVYQVRLSFAGPECGQTAQQRRGAADRSNVAKLPEPLRVKLLRL